MTSADWFEWKSEASHTLRKPGWIVVDVGERDVDGGGPWKTPHWAGHVFGLDDDGEHFCGFSVHVWKCGPNDSFTREKKGEKHILIVLIAVKRRHKYRTDRASRFLGWSQNCPRSKFGNRLKLLMVNKIYMIENELLHLRKSKEKQEIRKIDSRQCCI